MPDQILQGPDTLGMQVFVTTRIVLRGEWELLHDAIRRTMRNKLCEAVLGAKQLMVDLPTEELTYLMTEAGVITLVEVGQQDPWDWVEVRLMVLTEPAHVVRDVMGKDRADRV